ncbi:hypothetical protein AMAG_10059 [Allomyces macrogynus ATCC 38327]|uniref:DH domain-containing protein n=1 Tax=Allomyces macrogynus (strain ATCC 38327) TaxID=578462 RepID=A0A0L0SQQ8_ALLM3|nr:hypothetical protein AMAG_10059 [Allomyces macrogynus ATCC 38327]|eukprot:KNE64709.1 hypothetical protein AMAG_10059 [Allomyces macrogynus ATCC 38327]
MFGGFGPTTGSYALPGGQDFLSVHLNERKRRAALATVVAAAHMGNSSSSNAPLSSTSSVAETTTDAPLLSPQASMTRSSTVADSSRTLSSLTARQSSMTSPTTPTTPTAPPPPPAVPAVQSADEFLAAMLGDLHVADDSTGSSVKSRNDLETIPEQEDIDDIYGFYAEQPETPVAATHDRSTKMSRNRQKAVLEIVSTEATYVEMLQVLLNKVVYPLRDAVRLTKRPPVSAEDVHALFGNLDEICTFHQTLLTGLQERVAFWDDEQKISDIFLTISPFLKMYKLYLQGYPHALETLNRLRTGPVRQYGEFQRLIQAAHASPEFKGLDITSFMILPIQRIPRYILLLEQLVHYTDEHHPDYEGLSQCVKELRRTADHINEELKRFEAQKRVVDIQSRLVGRPSNLPPLVTAARRFIAEGDVLTPMLMVNDERSIIVFSDLVVIARRNRDGSLEYKDEYDLWASTLDVQDPAPNSPAPLFTFQLAMGRRHYSLGSPNVDERNKWVRMIGGTMVTLRNGGVRRMTDASASASAAAIHGGGSAISIDRSGSVSGDRRPSLTSNGGGTGMYRASTASGSSGSMPPGSPMLRRVSLTQYPPPLPGAPPLGTPTAFHSPTAYAPPSPRFMPAPGTAGYYTSYPPSPGITPSATPPVAIPTAPPRRPSLATVLSAGVVSPTSTSHLTGGSPNILPTTMSLPTSPTPGTPPPPPPRRGSAGSALRSPRHSMYVPRDYLSSYPMPPAVPAVPAAYGGVAHVPRRSTSAANLQRSRSADHMAPPPTPSWYDMSAAAAGYPMPPPSPTMASSAATYDTGYDAPFPPTLDPSHPAFVGPAPKGRKGSSRGRGGGGSEHGSTTRSQGQGSALDALKSHGF